jgi:hypothetical protein
MQRRKWDAKTKAMIVLEGLKGKPVAELCTEHQITFTSYNNPKGNADTERVIRTLKEECLWLQEWTCPFELSQAFEGWVADYNEHYLHSTLGYNPQHSLSGITTGATALRSWSLDSGGALQRRPQSSGKRWSRCAKASE